MEALLSSDELPVVSEIEACHERQVLMHLMCQDVFYRSSTSSPVGPKVPWHGRTGSCDLKGALQFRLDLCCPKPFASFLRP